MKGQGVGPAGVAREQRLGERGNWLLVHVVVSGAIAIRGFRRELNLS